MQRKIYIYIYIYMFLGRGKVKKERKARRNKLEQASEAISLVCVRAEEVCVWLGEREGGR